MEMSRSAKVFLTGTQQVHLHLADFSILSEDVLDGVIRQLVQWNARGVVDGRHVHVGHCVNQVAGISLRHVTVTDIQQRFVGKERLEENQGNLIT